MRCARCHRALTNPGLTIELKDGPIYFGSACARTAGLRTKRRRAAAKPVPRRDSKTVDWVDTLAGAPA